MERAGQDVEAGVKSNINIQGLKGSVEGEVLLKDVVVFL
jgi:hypothetical protein